MDENEQKLIERTERVAQAVEGLQRLQGGNSPSATGGSANFNLNAGGAGVYVAATACLMTLSALIVACVFAVGFFNEQSAQIRELRMRDAEIQAYINAGYVQPKQEEEKK